jgi:hypothetical protein
MRKDEAELLLDLIESLQNVVSALVKSHKRLEARVAAMENHES